MGGSVVRVKTGAEAGDLGSPGAKSRPDGQ